MIGPNTEDTPIARPNIELITGRLAGGTRGSVSNVAPEKMNAEARPATARPTMNTAELGAAPHSSEPTSKMAMASKNTHFVE